MSQEEGKTNERFDHRMVDFEGDPDEFTTTSDPCGLAAGRLHGHLKKYLGNPSKKSILDKSWIVTRHHFQDLHFLIKLI